MKMDLHWFDGETVALINVWTEAINQILQLRLCFLPCSSINLFSLWVSSWLFFLLLFTCRWDILSILTRSCVRVLAWALHSTCGIATESLARVMDRLFSLFNFTGFFFFELAFLLSCFFPLNPFLFFKFFSCFIGFLLAKSIFFFTGDTFFFHLEFLLLLL